MSVPVTPTTPRQAFAHVLRGVAALAVLVGHYLYTFRVEQAGIAGLLGVPPLPSMPALPGVLEAIGQFGIVYGQFGVGVFFLISGYVIPFAATTETRGAFLLRRALRIFPVYIVGFSFVAASVWWLDRAMGTTFPYSLPHLAAHWGVVTLNWLGYSRIDGISWTLEVELYYYLFVLLFGARVVRLGLAAWLLVACALAALALARVQVSVVQGLQFWAALLLVGGLGYHAFDRGELSRRRFLVLQGAIALLAIGVWLRLDRAIFGAQWIAGYLIAMVVFAACFALRHRIRVRPLGGFLADISYPLYVVHALPGYVVMYWVTLRSGSLLLGVACALGVALGVAILLHFAMERPAQALARRLAPRRPQVFAAPAPAATMPVSPAGTTDR